MKRKALDAALKAWLDDVIAPAILKRFLEQQRRLELKDEREDLEATGKMSIEKQSTEVIQ